MTRTVATPRRAAKKPRFRIRNQNFPIRNQISPVMQIMKGLLPPQKAAWHLHILTGQSLSNCQKALSGHRRENADMLIALITSRHGWAVVQALAGAAGETVGWVEEFADLADIRDLKREQLRNARALERREARLIEAEARR